MDIFKGQLSMESAQFIESDFAEELLKEFQRLRDIGDYSQAAMRKCKVPALTKLYTNMDLEFIIDPKLHSNAHFVLPLMDKNHPFYKQMLAGMTLGRSVSSSAVTLQSIRESNKNFKEASVDLKTGRVKGYFTKVKVTIVMAANFFTDIKQWKSTDIVGVFLHELGHAFTYFEYFGNITRNSTLIDQASKTVMDPSFNSEEKFKLLKEVERQLGTEELGLEKTINLPANKAKNKVQEVLITEDLFNHTRTESSTPFYDARNIEQLADQFVTLHGAGRWQAEVLSKLYASHGHQSTYNALEFVIVEIIKLTLFLLAALLNPFMVLVYGLAFFPMTKWYDDPKARIEHLRRQMIANLKSTDSKMIKAKLVDDIAALDEMISKLNKYPTIFEMYCNYLNPVGRRMYKEEKFRKGIEDALNNDLFLKATELELA